MNQSAKFIIRRAFDLSLVTSRKASLSKWTWNGHTEKAQRNSDNDESVQNMITDFENDQEESEYSDYTSWEVESQRKTVFLHILKKCRYNYGVLH